MLSFLLLLDCLLFDFYFIVYNFQLFIKYIWCTNFNLCIAYKWLIVRTLV